MPPGSRSLRGWLGPSCITVLQCKGTILKKPQCTTSPGDTQVIKDIVNFAVFEMLKCTGVIFLAGVCVGFILGALAVIHGWLL